MLVMAEEGDGNGVPLLGDGFTTRVIRFILIGV